ncbi:MAG TPA: Hsp20/alpha crystallin family protein [Ktedonobacteraceae bacterium]|jgi:HSP20 family protein|nr:Hsp20/alpha crystallin family protein [Ktedonobacteraceae bacterium]
MTTLMRFDPFTEVLSLRDAVNKLFEESFVRPGWFGTRTSNFAAPMDVCETEQGYQVYVLLPGINPENIDLTVQQNTLTVKGQYQPIFNEGQKVSWLLQEIGYGTFERTITFPKPVDADHIETTYENGILHLVIPFSEVSRPKKISITGSQQKQLVGAGAR